ncbi:MAG TPA: hypothetical protein DET40_00595 [Lentisphaeria bacterium]|nr:MAG: hypothetical protein A2X45_09490 [Lentisphaerae bacterium GWF2_50_93]HCE42031.1 hypothetical protein [Lentisphaeria bacterium]
MMSKPDSTENQIAGSVDGISALRHRIAGGLCIFSAFIVFLLPLKFGGIVGIPEVLFFPDSAITWLIFTWPVMMFPVISSLMLLLVIVVTSGSKINFRLMLSLIWTALAFTSMIGYANASTGDFPILEISHFFGIASFCFAVYLLLEFRPDMRNLLINAVVLAAVFSTLMGLQQLIWGFKETLDYVYQQEIKTGIKTSSQLQLRVVQTRVYSPFTLCNSLAAHLVLTIPLCVVLIWKNTATLKSVIVLSATMAFVFVMERCGHGGFLAVSIAWSAIVMITLFKFSAKYARMISIAASITCAAVMFTILYYTGSRGAVLAFGLAVAVTIAIFPFNMKIRIASVVSVLAATSLGLYLINAGRHLGSMEVRMDYFMVAMKLFKDNFLLGTGWGDFFHSYTILKSFTGTEAPHSTHNFILDFASQAGIAGLVVSIIAVSFPICLIISSSRKKPVPFGDTVSFAIILGWTAWVLHSLSDINIQVPGTIATAILMIMLLKPDESHGGIPEPRSSGRTANLMLRASLCLIGFFTLWIGAKRLEGEYALCQLIQLCEPSMSSQGKSRTASRQQVETALQEAVRKMPYSPFPWATAGNLVQAHRNWVMTEVFYRKAIELSPERSSFYHHLAVAQLMQGKKQEALENIRKASELFPNSEEYKELYKKISEELKKGG